jgi:hypothetical protein
MNKLTVKQIDMIYLIDCPSCEHPITIPSDATRNEPIHCLKCCKYWRLNEDAEFVDGMWHNLTTLEPVKI